MDERGGGRKVSVIQEYVIMAPKETNWSIRPASLFNGLLVLFIIGVIMPGSINALDPAPATETRTVTDTYHGVSVTDDYRWLEDFEDPVVKKWNQSQNEYTRSILDTVSAREQIKEYLTELMGSSSTDYYSLKKAGSVLFAMKFQPPKEQSLLVKLQSVDDLLTEEVVLDVTELNPEGTTSIDFFVPSPDGSLLAVSLSETGSEKGTVYVFDVATGKETGDVVPNVNGPTAGGDVAWEADGSGFYFTRYPHEGERPEEDLSFFQQVYYHKMGTAQAEDKYVIGEEFPRIAEIRLEASDDGQYLIVTVYDGDGGERAHYLRNPSGEFTQVTRFEDLIPDMTFGPDNSTYMLSHKNSPMGKILKLGPGVADLSLAEVLVDESKVSIRSFLPTANYLYLIDIDGGPSRMRVLDLKSGELKGLPAKPISSFGGLTKYDDDVILFRNSSYTEPSAWYQFDPATWQIQATALYKTSPADFSDIVVKREFATSKDGTLVPVNIIYRTGTELDGSNPTILTGYGGYGISRTPSLSSTLRLWYDQGGIYVVANIRGGGEYGEAWHLAGNLTKKQNVFDDFIACAEYLIEKKYTSSDMLIIQGGSNGGLLMGAAFTQRPELFRAVVTHVGIYDMLRVELDPNGVFNITEFGTVTNPDHFKALYAYSPFHNAADQVAYPSIMFLTGDHDGRVNPGQSRKMTGLMQAATNSGRPVLLRTTAKAGHGGGTALSEKIEKQTDVYSFIISQLGLKFRYDR